MENAILSPTRLTRLLALAAALEGEGWLNNAKLLRAALETHLTHAAHALALPADRASLLAETDHAIADLAQLDLPPALLEAIATTRAALEAGSLPLYAAAPDPYLCRTCGSLSFATTEGTATCPVCGAHPETFHRIRPTYWIAAFDPFASQEHLRATPQAVAELLDTAVEQPTSGGWTLREAITHLKDAQGVLDDRVDLILDQDNPVLESQAVFEWASGAASRPVTIAEIFAAYRASREHTLARLESLPLRDWWRTGYHTEFGELKLFEQVSYFACHELSHLAQIKRLAGIPAS